MYVYLTAKVEPIADSTYPVVIDPWHICVDQVDSVPSTEAVFTVTNVTQSTIRLRLAYLSEDCLWFNLPGGISAGESAVGTVELNAVECMSTFVASMTFEADDPENSRITIPVERSLSCAGNDSGGDWDSCSEDGSSGTVLDIR